MKLPVIFPELEGQQYDCEQCGKGCRELAVHLTERDKDKIDRQGWADKLDLAPYVRLGRSYVLNHTPNQECVFLRRDGLCSIHAEFGFAEKPLACQLYPFTLEAEGDGLRASVRFDCPAIAKSTGGSLARHRQELVRIAANLESAAPGVLAAPTKPIELTPGRELSGDELDHLVDQLDQWVGDTDRPVMDRIVGLDNLVETLGAARLSKIKGDRFAEFLDMLVAELPTVVESFEMGAVPPPTARQAKLARQAVFSHCENIRPAEARARLLRRLSYRLDQVKRARRLAAGTGAMPSLVRSLSGGTFEQLEQVGPDPELSPYESAMLMTRYLRARITGRTAFGNGYFGWPVLDGLRALLLAVAIIGWVTRYVALTDERRSYTLDDLVRAVGIVDRNATRSPELGTRSAHLRMTYLSQDQGILRLLRAHTLW